MARKTFDDAHKKFVLDLKREGVSNRKISELFSEEYFKVSNKLIGRRLDEWDYSPKEAPEEPNIENIDEDDPNNWWRKCPDCGKKIEYTRKRNWKKYRKSKKFCRSCSMKGERHPFSDKKHSEDYKKKMAEMQTDRSFNGTKKENREVKECKHPECNQTYEVRVSKEQEFCSIGCYNKWAANYRNHYISKPERLFKRKLKNCPKIDDFEQQFHLEGKFYDFRVEETLIEIDGTWWHGKGENLEELEGIRKDIRRNDFEKDNIAEQSRFNLVRIWTDEINNFKLQKLI